MARINLLPWREELRRERQKRFMMSLMMTAVLGVVLVFLIGLFFDQKIRQQQFRNELIKTEIRTLETKIKRIDELERTRARLISRKEVIEQLQASRSMTVQLLDNLAKSIPTGVTLESVRQQGLDLSLTGSSQSNARVSAYLQELSRNELFQDPELDFVRAATQREASATEPYQFSIKVTLRPTRPDEEADDFDDEEDLGAYNDT
jgi:type IV pilus assembly protein PilN